MTTLTQAQAQYATFLDAFQSLVLSTVTPEGLPQASYAPFVRDAQGNFYIFVSGLAAHTQNLHSQPVASILFIEDEQDCHNFFARRRLTYHCTVRWLPRETSEWEAIVSQFQAQFGEIIGLLRGLQDFQIAGLEPQSGRFVVGFGAAYAIEGKDLSQLVQLKGKA